MYSAVTLIIFISRDLQTYLNMPKNEIFPSEKNEIAQELLGMLDFIQKLGRRGSYETYGETNESIYDINKSLLETRIKIHRFINKESFRKT